MASAGRRNAPFSESEIKSDSEDLDKMDAATLEDTETLSKISDEDLKKIIFEEDLPKIKIIDKSNSKKEEEENDILTKTDVFSKENISQKKEKTSDDKEILPQKEASVRINKLPIHDEDFATKWFYALEPEMKSEEVIDEYNSYLQVLDELEKGQLDLPKDIVGKDIAYDLKTFILKDFKNTDIKFDAKNNLVHRAWYAHCAKRAIDSLREGIFVGEEGYKEKRPEIADIIERRINEVIFDKMIKIDK